MLPLEIFCQVVAPGQVHGTETDNTIKNSSIYKNRQIVHNIIQQRCSYNVPENRNRENKLPENKNSTM